MAEYKFPEGFLWGCATASYQIEGSPLADGAGESIWHRFSHTPDKVVNGDTGDVACDHYNRFREDVGLMKELGLQSYRFSIAWPRIFPDGKGGVNQAGIDFYSALVDELLKADIIPAPTLYHWDLPQALEDGGGWPNPDTAKYFGDYAALLYDKLGDRVEFWITLNEPFVTAVLGYGLGIHAPGLRDFDLCARTVHTLLRAHGLAVEAFRQTGRPGKIGITVSTSGVQPASDDAGDQQAADRMHAYLNEWFLDPIFFGTYPENLTETPSPLPELTADDVATIQRPIDFVGINYYSRTVWREEPDAFLSARTVPQDGPHTEMGWEVYPDGLYQILTWAHEHYNGPDMYITENGSAFDDTVADDGSVPDSQRLEYLRDHFMVAHRAIQDGVKLHGYYVWSLLDNFEWTFGYSRRFGIVRVDYETQQRTIKQSGHWYADVIANNGL